MGVNILNRMLTNCKNNIYKDKSQRLGCFKIRISKSIIRHINRQKEKSTWSPQCVQKKQDLFLIKHSPQIKIEGNISTWFWMCKKTFQWISPWWKAADAFPLRWGTRCGLPPWFWATFVGGSSQCNKTGKRNEGAFYGQSGQRLAQEKQLEVDNLYNILRSYIIHVNHI